MNLKITSNCRLAFQRYTKVMSLNYETLKNFRGYFIELLKQDMNNVDLNKVFDCLELAYKEHARSIVVVCFLLNRP